MQFTEKLAYLGVVLPRLNLFGSRDSKSARKFQAADGMTAHWHDTFPEDSHVQMAWDFLLRSNPNSTAFHSSQWQAALARPFVRASRYRLLTLSAGEEMTGVFPLTIGADNTLETPGSMISDYLDPLVSERHAQQTWRGCMHALTRVPGVEPSQIVLHNIRQDAIHLEMIQAAAEECGFVLTTESDSITARVPICSSWDEYLSKLGAHDRKEIRRKLRNAETKAGATMTVAESEDDVPDALDTVFGFMRQAGGSKGMKAQWTYRPLFKRAASGLVRAKRLKVYLLKLENRISAGLICFPSKSGPLLWAAGYDNAMSQYSPGIVLFALALQHTISAGAKFFDLLRGQSRYKSELGTVETPLIRAILRKK